MRVEFRGKALFWHVEQLARYVQPIISRFMSQTATRVHIGDAEFDVAGVGGWIDQHVYLFLVIAAVAFIFWLFQKDGFAEKFLSYRVRMRELDDKKLDAARDLADIFRRRFEGKEPMLPFGEDLDRGDK